MDTTHNLLSRQEHDQQNVEKGKKKLDTVVITIRRCSSQEMKPTKKEMKRKMNVSCLCVYLMLSYIIGIICKAKHLLLFFDYINCVRLHLCVWTYSHTHTIFHEIVTLFLVHHHISLVKTSYLSNCDSFVCMFSDSTRNFACVVMFAWLVKRLHKILQTLWLKNIRRKKLWFMSLKLRVIKINWHLIYNDLSDYAILS